jgi:CBS domain-containing protein
VLVREVMTAPAVTLRADDTVRYAAQLLLQHRISSAPVVDDEGLLVGVVSEADLVRGRTQPDPRAHLRPLDRAGPGEPAAATTVGDVMTSRVMSVRAGSDVDEAARVLLDSGVKALPVLEGRRVVGVVARRDLLRSLARPDADVRRDVRALLHEVGQGDGWDVAVVDGVVTLTPTAGAPPSARVAAVLARTVPGVVRVHVLRPAAG